MDYFKRDGFSLLRGVLDAGMAVRKLAGQQSGRVRLTIQGALVLPKHAERGVQVSVHLHRENAFTEVNLEKVEELEREMNISLPVGGKTTRRKSKDEIEYEAEYGALGIKLEDHIFPAKGKFIARSPWPFEADVLLGQDILDQMTLTFNSPDGTFTITPH